MESARGTSGVLRWYRRTTRDPRRCWRATGKGPAPFPARTEHRRAFRREAVTVGSWTFPSPSMVAPACRTRWAAPCAICASRSPTGATSGARTACPRRSSGKDYAFLPKDQVLTFEEIERLARVFVSLGVEKLRITGGEPLVRRDLPDLIAMLAAIRRPDGGEVDLTLTTNGSALRALARPLADAGLKRVTVSLDSLDDAVFGAMNGIDFPVERVLDGIAAAIEAGLAAGEDQHGRPAWRQRVEHRADGRLGARHRGHPPVHRVHGRGPLERLAARRGRPGAGADRDARRRVAGGAGRPELPRRGRRPMALSGRAAASSGSSHR